MFNPFQRTVWARKPGTKEVDVVHGPAGVDGATADVPKDEQEESGHDGWHDQQLRGAGELQEGSPGRLGGGSEEAGTGVWGGRSSLPAPCGPSNAVT